MAAVAAALLVPAGASAQSLTLLPFPESVVEVDGTSNRSDWTVESKEIAGSFQVSQGDGSLLVESGVVQVTVRQIKSKSSIMDRLMYRAFDAVNHPEIEFSMSSPAEGQAGAEGYTLAVAGTLAMAGASNPIEMTVLAAPQEDGRWRFTGQYVAAMTDYGMTPPTAMFGALHTGDEVTIRFDVVATP